MNRSRLSRARRIVVATTVGVASMGAVAGAAYAATPSSPSTPSTSTTPKGQSGDHDGIGHLVRRAVHVEAIVKTKSGYKTVDIDRGTLNSVSSSSISITRPDGKTVTATVNGQTKFRGKTESQLAKGDKVVVVQSGGSALTVGSRKADQPPANSSQSSQPQTANAA